MNDDESPVPTARAGSDEHKAKLRESALKRHEERRGRGQTGRHPNMVPPSYSGPRRHASDDPLRFSGLPGPSRLHEGMNASELIAWRRNRTRKENAR